MFSYGKLGRYGEGCTGVEVKLHVGVLFSLCAVIVRSSFHAANRMSEGFK